MIRPLDDAAAIDLVHDLVATRSVSTEEGAAAALITSRMAALGFETEIDAAGNAVVRGGQGPLEIALVGHMDTVPGDLPVHIKEGVLYGRGAVDAKGPLAAFLVAASRLMAEEAALRLRVVACVEEEVASSRGARYLATTDAPDMLIIGEPSGWDGVTLGYKGYLRARLTLVGENTHTAHDARTLPARACTLWASLEDAARGWSAGRERAFDQLLPALLDIRCENDGARAKAVLDLTLRLPLDLPPDEAIVWLSERAATEGAAVSVLPTPMPAWSGPRTGVVARALGRAILERGGRTTFQTKTGTADLNVLAPAWGCPSVAYGPGDAALDHTPHEHLELAEYLSGIEVLVAGVRALAQAAPVQA